MSDTFDAHADLVCSQLTESKTPYFRLNLDTESLKNTKFHWAFDGFTIESNRKSTSSQYIKCVWARRAFVELSLDEANLSNPGIKIWKGEWDRGLIGLYQSLKDIPWLNRLDKSYKADNKFFQYNLAKEIGFSLAPTITTNDKSRLVEFAKQQNQVVIKMLHQGFYLDSDGKNKGMYVNKVKATDLDEFGEMGENPITLQKYIEKSYEVRYTVVGNEHHVCKIDSQKSSRANVDWRRYDLAHTPHSLLVPPPEIRGMVTSLMQNLGLEYGALDFIVSLDGEWFFLEVNSMGQWLWIENLTGTKISRSISKWLISNLGGNLTID
ncbi:MAG: hypothetical protein IPN92_13080 [Chromatiaceae bacterium]|nr:hypothetical protein [Chromatiaceae bacterium]